MNHQATGCCCTCHCMYFLVQLLLLLMILFFYVPCFFLTVIAVVAIDVIVVVAPDAVDFADDFAVIIAVVIMYVYAVNVAVYSIDAPSAANITVFVSCLVNAVALVLLLFLCSGCY